ncbi:hypothetical protein JOC37_002039 [Desulfohalotomaculum tongense]|uniref:alkaline phosphatase family protein n=1 Tax=Desulforadius tongensis TaxID=1216062 RepID=UPI001957BAF7|nr:alkaline phosphatase family protein [Desulforadius tongensis]MBM7855637.1 hypothetical protein [Desulforadius tongensis]
MKVRAVQVLITIILLLLMVEPICAEPGSSSNVDLSGKKKSIEEEKDTKVAFLIIADGLQAKALNNSQVPNIKGLGSAGLKAERVIPVYPEDVLSSIASILTGSTPLQNQGGEKSNILHKPTLLKVMEEKGIKTAMFDGTGNLKVLGGGVSHVCKGPFNGKDSLVIENAINELDASNTYFNVLVLPELRPVLEKYGINSAEYRRQVTSTDNQIGRLLHYLHNKGLYEESLVIVTGTCGEPPLVMKGPQLKVGTSLPPVNLTDIAPTIAYLSGLKMKQAEGMVLYNAIKPRTNRSETYLLSQRVEDLSRAYADALEGMHRLEKEKLEVKQLQDKMTEEKQIIQQAIEQRDNKIALLSSKINFMKMTGLLLLIILGLGYIVEYKILRKRFLMF